MEKEGFFVETKQMIEEYIEDRILLLRLQLTEKAAKLSAVVIVAVAVCFLLLILITIVSFIAGYYLSKATGSYGLGFGILAVVYLLLILILLYVNKKYLANYIINKVVKSSFKKDENGI